MRAAWIGAALLAGSLVATAASPKPLDVPLKDAMGSTVGHVYFLQDGSAVVMRVRLDEVIGGLHAIHVHANGDCTPPDFTSAGGHFNPENKQHGFHSTGGHHAGDFPVSIHVHKDGVGKARLLTSDLSLDPASPHAIYGKSVVVHELVDDQQTDPAGASGKRIACGVIPSAPSM